jgi:hypothetical protein
VLRAVLLVLIACAPVACTSRPAAEPCGPCQSPSSADAAGKSVALPRSERLEKLAEQRVALARKRLVLLRSSFDRGVTTLEELIAGSREVAFAARDSGLRGDALLGVLKEYRDAVVALRDLTHERAAKGAVGEDAVTRIDALAAEAEFWLEDAR